MTAAAFAKANKYFLFFRCCVFALLLSTASSCRVVRVIDAGSSNCAGSGQHYCNMRTVRTSIWKGKNVKTWKTDCVQGIGRFKVTTRAGDVLLGLLSAGFYVRQRIEWDCAQRRGTSAITDTTAP